MLSAVMEQHPWHWQPHPEVWLLVALVIGLGFYVDRVIAPTMVAAGEAPSPTARRASSGRVSWCCGSLPIGRYTTLVSSTCSRST